MKNHSSIDLSVSSSDLSACITLAVDLAKQVFQVAGEVSSASALRAADQVARAVL